LKGAFRHGINLHHIVFSAAALVIQIAISNGKSMFQADYSGNLSGSDNNVEVVDEDSNAKEQQDGKKYDRNVD
jgi:hypothetical protein